MASPRGGKPTQNAGFRQVEGASMGYRLLGCKGCGSAIVEAAFACAGVPLDLEEVDYGRASPTRERLLAVNPLGQVPTLVLPDGEVMTESLAIIQHLDDGNPGAGLVPARGHPGRIAFLRWSTFIVAAIYPTYTYGDEPAKWVEDAQGARQLRESTDRHREKLWLQVEAEAGEPWFLGEARSALDIYVAVMTRWRPGILWFAKKTPKLAAIAQKTAAIPEMAAVMKRNFD
jgi:GST-like protein